jgi:hypothetical protein
LALGNHPLEYCKRAETAQIDCPCLTGAQLLKCAHETFCRYITTLFI